METVARTIEGAGLNTGSLRLLGDAGTHDLRGSDVAAATGNARELSANFGFDRGGRNQRTTVVGRNDAGVDVQVGTMDRQAIDLLQQNAGARSTGATQAALLIIF